MSSVLKTGEKNLFHSIDVCSLALEVGCTFVARSFSGDAKQMVPLIQAAMRHNGTAVIDVVSPCITFNNHDGSTKSYSYVKEHDVVLQELGLIQHSAEQTVDYPEGSVQTVELNDGRELVLRKLDSRAHNVQDREAAFKILHDSQEQGELLTGLFYVNEQQESLLQKLNLTQKPLVELQDKDLRPSPELMQKILGDFR
jgi:2-oxoglutarate ferredoxin oxidoreductase subunit beta